MYNTLKKCVLFLIPKKFVIKNELFLRNIYAFFYKGKKHECTVCNKKNKAFIRLKNKDLLCPFCGSLSRNRRLWELLNQDGIYGNILHFSPSRGLYKKFKKIKDINYYSTDFENEFIADYHFDITAIDQENEKFDIVICYHILEHIENDQKAIKELYRILKPNGKIYLQTPFKDGAIYEDYSITSPSERLKHFGQSDHVRIYSINGLVSRLREDNFKVEEKRFLSEEKDFYFGFLSPETILIATKNLN